MMSRYDDRESLLPTEDAEDHEQQIINSINYDEAPRDRFYLCHIAFFFIGLSQLLPWNFLVTATNYWMFKFRDVNNFTKHPHPIFDDSDKSNLQTVFDSYLAIASNLPFLFVFAFSFSKHLKKIDETVKNCVAFVLILIIFSSITSFVLVNTDTFQTIFLICTLALVFLLNSVAAFIQASFAGLASLLPNAIMHLMVTGQATSGLFAVAAQILSLAGNWSIVESTFAYFVFANFVLIFTLVIYFVTTKTDYFQYHNDQIVSGELESIRFDLQAYYLVFSKMWPYCITLMINFWISLSVYPAVVVLVSPQNEHEHSFWTSKFFLPVCCFLIFNLCDFLGRYLGQFGLLRRERCNYLLTISILRIGLIPLFMLTNVHPRRFLPVLFSSEYFYIAFMIIFGLTNGYLVLNVFVNGPLSVPPVYRKLSGFFLMLFLGLGLTFGSLTSTILVRFI